MYVNAKHMWLARHPILGELVVNSPNTGVSFNTELLRLSSDLGSADMVVGTTALLICSMSHVVAPLKRGDATAPQTEGESRPPISKRDLEQKIRRIIRREGVGTSDGAASPLWHTNRLVFLVHSDIPNPPLQPMTWLNISAIDAQAKLIIVWTPVEALAVLEALSEESGNNNTSSTRAGAGPFALLRFGDRAPGVFSSSSAEANEGGVPLTQGTAATIALQGASSGTTQAQPSRLHPTSKDERASIALAALTEIDGINRTDAVRLLNNVATFADILTADASVEFARGGKLPDFTKKKAAKLDAVFNAPFPTTALSLQDYYDKDELDSTASTHFNVTGPVGTATGSKHPEPAKHDQQVLPGSQNHQPFVFNNPATAAALQALLDAEMSSGDDD